MHDNRNEYGHRLSIASRAVLAHVKRNPDATAKIDPILITLIIGLSCGAFGLFTLLVGLYITQ